MVTRAFSGRAGRSIASAYAHAATAPEAPKPAPYPVQRGLTLAMREAGPKNSDIDRMQTWTASGRTGTGAAGRRCGARARGRRATASPVAIDPADQRNTPVSINDVTARSYAPKQSAD